jgi:hypothetical protein
MADYNERLSRLHQNVVEDELGLSAQITEDGWIEFNDSDLGEVTINLREYNPEFMNMHAVVFADYKNIRTHSDLVQACNNTNFSLDSSQELARLTVSDEYNVVRASVPLVLATPRAMPPEPLVRAVTPRALASLKAAAREFATELQKLPVGSAG